MGEAGPSARAGVGKGKGEDGLGQETGRDGETGAAGNLQCHHSLPQVLVRVKVVLVCTDSLQLQFLPRVHKSAPHVKSSEVVVCARVVAVQLRA